MLFYGSTLSWLPLLASLVQGYQLKTTLWAPESFVQPDPAALFVESLYHVSPVAYCELLADLATEPISDSARTDEEVLQHLLERSYLTQHQRGLLKTSLALNEFAPVASFNGTAGLHSCSSTDTQTIVYTDFLEPFDYGSGTAVRYQAPVKDAQKQKRTMSGYGAHLALKRTDYLVIDDSNPTKPKPEEETLKVEPLKFNQMSNIGLRAVSRIVNQDNPLEDLEDISQNFPTRTKRLLAAKVSKELKDEVQEIKTIIRGDIFMVNGVDIDPTPDKLLPLLRQESALSNELQKYGYSIDEVINILTFDLESPGKVDKFDVRSPAVVYLNDFEKDEMYEKWPESVETFMRPLYPGQFHSIRRNAHTVVMYADLTKAEDREVISNFAMFVSRGLPLRWGIVPENNTPEKALLAAAWTEVVQKRGATAAVEFLAAAVEEPDLQNIYEAWQKKSDQALAAFDSLQDTLSVDFTKEWKVRFGTENLYVNGRPTVRDENMMQQVSAYLRDDTMMIQEALLQGGIIDSGDLQDYFLGPTPLPVYSKALFAPRKYVTLNEAQSFKNEACHEEMNIAISGEDWPADLMDNETNPCIRRISGEKRLIINGRIVTDLSPAEIPTLLLQEKEDMEKYKAAAKRAGSPMSAEILTLIRTSTVLRTILPPVPSTRLTTFSLGSATDCVLRIEVYLDPLSENAQRWSTVLRTISTIPKIAIKITLVPKLNIKELPLKRFYRYLLDAKPTSKSRSIEFAGIPADLLVFSLEVWNNWVTSPVHASVDLDNLHLGTQAIDADFEVSHILVEGHAKESKNPMPPRGAQLTLTGTDGQYTETIIMANLGYFQFKTLPGIWTLAIKAGRSSEIYELDNRDIEVSSWAGTTIYPRLTRKLGKENAEILDDKQVAAKGSLWSKLKNFSGTDVKTASRHADINIFTVASGHLYERFVYIMISSVMAHTKHSVKFWFISNFLSPQFRQFIPHLAAHLNFEYEMITFTWPHWLRQQTEKQRIIWGYKILFLDVMFPLDLEKVIFVDADQIVRTDMIELINEDLKGKVWGYTPMCDSRAEIEGFRFWKQGYWKDFLRGKPYHISALYVIDLVAFRAQATGDRLRQQYHQLSADPASLSNLDQDLPNHLQAQIPIHSLNQNWLWCETWCSDESLKDAKTIDLCQNPMTKEPKLDRARRQLPEWTIYDQAIKDFAKTVAADRDAHADAIGSIVVDVDSVGQNVEMKRDQLGHGDDDDDLPANESTNQDASASRHDEL